MTDKELLKLIQAKANETAQNFPFKRTARLELVHSEVKEDGTTECYCVGADMPLLVYRMFYVDKDGNVTENSTIENAADRTRHFNVEVKPTLSKLSPVVFEGPDYEIVVENVLNGGAVEVKLRSTNGRNVTMVEVYRYFDYVSKIFFVACVSVSFGGQYLFCLTPDSKHLRLITNTAPEVQPRLAMMTELLAGRALPSYQTIDAGSKLLASGKANVTMTNGEGVKTDYESTFCYDDPETETRFVFLAKKGDASQGVILSQDTLTQKLVTPAEWSDAQKASIEKIKESLRVMNDPAAEKSVKDEIRSHVVSFFADNLDWRYKAFKEGKIGQHPAAEQPAAAPAETPAETPAEAPAEAPKAEEPAEEPKAE